MFAVPENTIALRPAVSAAHPARIAAEYARDRDRWAHLLRYDPDDRYAALITADELFEVWLLSWLPGQTTGLHDHGGAEGAFTVVTGTVSERVIRGGTEVLHEVAAGQSRVFGIDYVHQVHNAGVDPAVTIHVYRPSRVPMREYRFDPVGGLTSLES
ncbi:cysteine dioxygenase [Sciscionella marina]|uniref:cysteine dioxygenase n=1 Tax=Sciscionella marina TaxID=508770 RepID=UPI00035D3097|nr:cysteine dioxygenase family protein [Sciscionella marina]